MSFNLYTNLSQFQEFLDITNVKSELLVEAENFGKPVECLEGTPLFFQYRLEFDARCTLVPSRNYSTCHPLSRPRSILDQRLHCFQYGFFGMDLDFQAEK